MTHILEDLTRKMEGQHLKNGQLGFIYRYIFTHLHLEDVAAIRTKSVAVFSNVE